jgi:hypothetical protein
VGAGGTRMELSRERVVLDHYRRELGARGAALGEAVLRVCRGVALSRTIVTWTSLPSKLPPVSVCPRLRTAT